MGMVDIIASGPEYWIQKVGTYGIVYIIVWGCWLGPLIVNSIDPWIRVCTNVSDSVSSSESQPLLPP